MLVSSERYPCLLMQQTNLVMAGSPDVDWF